MKIIFILFFTFGDAHLISYNKMLGEISRGHSENHHFRTEQYWASKVHRPHWRDKAGKVKLNLSYIQKEIAQSIVNSCTSIVNSSSKKWCKLRTNVSPSQ